MLCARISLTLSSSSNFRPFSTSIPPISTIQLNSFNSVAALSGWSRPHADFDLLYGFNEPFLRLAGVCQASQQNGAE